MDAAQSGDVADSWQVEPDHVAEELLVGHEMSIPCHLRRIIEDDAFSLSVDFTVFFVFMKMQIFRYGFVSAASIRKETQPDN